jgi:glutamine synthetase
MAGFAERHNIYDDTQRRKVAEIINRIDADRIRTIRVGFADQHGVIRGKSFAASQIKALFSSGMTAPSSLLLKDLSHRTILPVWQNEITGLAGVAGLGDIILMPDPDRFFMLDWLDDTAWIQADIYHKDGTASPLDTRAIARRAANALADDGLIFNAGLEIEAHVYRRMDGDLSEDDIGQPGSPPAVAPLNRGYQLLTEHYADTMEPVADIIRQCCDGLGIPLRSVEIEFGPSQLEFTYGVQPGIGAADDMVLLRSALRQTLARAGYHISFMCRPGIEGSFANGWHLHQSLSDTDGQNVFMPTAGQEMTSAAASWVAGLLHHAPAMTLFAVPTITGYKRFRAHSLAPERVCWSHDGRGALVRALWTENDSASRIENRGGEPAANPYLYLASQMLAGRDGLTSGHTLPDAALDAYDPGLARLPHGLGAAIDLAAGDSFVRAAFGDVFIDVYTAIKRAEIARHDAHVNDWEHREYFAAF